MKVLQINSVCGIGSTGRIVTDIHQVLKSQGHESYIAYGRGEAINCENTLRIGNSFDNYAHVLTTRLFDKHGFGSKRATRKFIREIEKLKPDVIHLHNIHGYYLNIKIFFDHLRKIEKPVVWTLHDCWSFTGHCTYFDYVCCEKWKNECYSCPEKKTYPTSFVLDNSKQNYKKKKEIFGGINNLTIVTPSKWLANLIKESYLKEYPITVINNGIDLNIFRKIDSNFKDIYNIQNKFMILGVASVWNERKGLEYFLKSVDLLEKDEIIILVGLNEKQKKKLPCNTIGIVKTSNLEDLAKIYTAADVFVNPTLDDNFPTVNLESLACGTPIVSFATGGSVESVTANNGIIVKKKSVEQLLEAIREVKKNQVLVPSLKEVQKLYNKDDRYRDYIKLYNSVRLKKAEKDQNCDLN